MDVLRTQGSARCFGIVFSHPNSAARPACPAETRAGRWRVTAPGTPRALRPWKLSATASDTSILGSRKRFELRYGISRTGRLAPRLPGRQHVGCDIYLRKNRPRLLSAGLDVVQIQRDSRHSGQCGAAFAGWPLAEKLAAPGRGRCPRPASLASPRRRSLAVLCPVNDRRERACLSHRPSATVHHTFGGCARRGPLLESRKKLCR